MPSPEELDSAVAEHGDQGLIRSPMKTTAERTNATEVEYRRRTGTLDADDIVALINITGIQVDSDQVCREELSNHLPLVSLV